jgi:serine/threonine-protein kinase
MAGSGNDLGPCPHCGQPHAETVLLCPNTEKLLPLEGRILDGKFRFVRLLGEGGMGAVWKAENVLVKKTVAIKLMHVQFSKDEGVLARFRNEATAAGRIGSDHICDILDLGRSDLGPYIVMEMLKGKDFATFLQQRQGRVDPGVSVLIVREALKGLSAAHQTGIVHRDLKPENIFLHEPKPGQLMVKLMDFGISKFTEGSEAGKTGMGVLMGTPEYMSPEQTEGAAKVDHRTDIWAMGVILYWALSGRNPFIGPTLAATLINVSTREPPPLQALGGQVPQGLIDVIARCLRKNPAERWQSCDELSAALAPYENRNNGIYTVEGASASSPSGPGRTMASAGSPTPPPGLTMGSPTPPPMGAGPTMGGLGGGPGGMLGQPPGPAIGTAPTFVGGIGTPPAGTSPTWTGNISPSTASNSAPTLGGGFALSDDHLERRPDSSLGGGGGKGGIIALVLVLLVALGGGGWFAFTQLGKDKNGKAEGTVAANDPPKADGGGTPAADDGKADDGKAAAESSGGPVPVGGEAGAGGEGGAAADDGKAAATTGADDGKAPVDDGKTPATTGAADDGKIDDGGAADDGKSDDGGGKSDDGGGGGGGGTKTKPPKPKVDTTKVDKIAGVWVLKQRLASATTFDEAKGVCGKHKQGKTANLDGWRVATESEVKKILADGPNSMVWLRNGQVFHNGIKKLNPSPAPRIPGGRVLCVAG